MSFNALNFFFAQVHLAWLIVVPVLCIAVAGCGGWLVTRFVLNKKIGKAKNVAQSIVDEAKIEAKTLKKEAILEAKEEVLYEAAERAALKSEDFYLYKLYQQAKSCQKELEGKLI